MRFIFAALCLVAAGWAETDRGALMGFAWAMWLCLWKIAEVIQCNDAGRNS